MEKLSHLKCKHEIIEVSTNFTRDYNYLLEITSYGLVQKGK